MDVVIRPVQGIYFFCAVWPLQTEGKWGHNFHGLAVKCDSVIYACGNRCHGNLDRPVAVGEAGHYSLGLLLQSRGPLPHPASCHSVTGRQEEKTAGEKVSILPLELESRDKMFQSPWSREPTASKGKQGKGGEGKVDSGFAASTTINGGPLRYDQLLFPRCYTFSSLKR
ncbi:hypothetical protein FQN60_005717 [Etheostoma spectabile]|uniref:Uncharacterized protein n=1 Tax=Etheostoma spectabile TaxID=54343 RepID=A0A5J5CE73_9PERO|nr:hypothetical protein FQN60_005717 [Etheostoma spectabile]